MASLVHLGFQVIVFLVSYGIMFLLTPMILGQFFTYMAVNPIGDPAWQAIYDTNEDTAKFIVPLIPTIGIFLFLIKVLMIASVRGRD